MSAPEAFVIGRIHPNERQDAFAFHVRLAEHDPHLWTRTPEQIWEYAEQGSLFGAWRKGNPKDLVGLVYGALDQDHSPPQWEIGGLTIPSEHEGRGLGTVLVRFATATILLSERPWKASRNPRLRVLSHVHADNPKPRGIFTKLGFPQGKRVHAPGNKASPNMIRDETGNVPGDEFVFTAEGLKLLAQWFCREFNGSLRKGDSLEFKLGEEVTLADLCDGLRDMEANDSPP